MEFPSPDPIWFFSSNFFIWRWKFHRSVEIKTIFYSNGNGISVAGVEPWRRIRISVAIFVAQSDIFLMQFFHRSFRRYFNSSLNSVIILYFFSSEGRKESLMYFEDTLLPYHILDDETYFKEGGGCNTHQLIVF